MWPHTGMLIAQDSLRSIPQRTQREKFHPTSCPQDTQYESGEELEKAASAWIASNGLGFVNDTSSILVISR